jgi:hypothetical protein
MSTWQPIETAPKDGTAILGWHANYGGAVVSLEFVEDDLSSGFVGEWAVSELGCYGGSCWEGLDGITHWMPLPSPPDATP